MWQTAGAACITTSYTGGLGDRTSADVRLCKSGPCRLRAPFMMALPVSLNVWCICRDGQITDVQSMTTAE